MTYRSQFIRVSALFAALLLAGGAHAQQRTFNLPEQEATKSIPEFARQAGIQISAPTADLAGMRTPSIQGEMDVRAALKQLLSGTGLMVISDEGGTVVLGKLRTTNTQGDALAQPLVLRVAEGSPARVREEPKTNKSSQEAASEVVVTGTLIRGVKNIASPISVHTREDIERSGAGTVQRYIQTLSENFKGGASEGTVGSLAGGGQAINAVGGTGVNLRGLGNDSTLVLVNGRRLAPSNVYGNWIDVSMLPTAAIERIEVMPDGASALYGSDAVGGVINFIMREDYQGGEVGARYGAVSEGSLNETQVSGTWGTAWAGGSALLSYEYFHQDALELNGKSWTRKLTTTPFDLLPEQKRQGAYAAFKQALGERVQLFADANFANRKMPNNKLAAPFTPANSRVDIDAYSVTAGARAQLAPRHELEVATSYGESVTDRDNVNVLTNVMSSKGKTNTDVLSFDGKITGPLFQLSTGAVSYAAGAQYRTQNYRDRNLLTNRVNFERDRTLWAGFAEVRAPLMARSDGAELVGLTLAGRYEDYDDFGKTFNPKFGLVVSPSEDLRLRGTWGTSFKAPNLADLNPVSSQLAIVSVFDPTVNGNVFTALLFGGNPSLVPEEAESWTVGLDWTPHSIPNLKGRLTYYNISYTDRITTAQLGFSGVIPNFNTDALRYESVLTRFITRNPSVAQLQALIANTSLFSDFSGVPGGVQLSNVVALVDSRNINLSSDETTGVDFGLSYVWDLGGPSVETGVDGTYILKLDRTPAPGTPIIHAVDTAFNPADLKMRARAVLENKGFSGALFVNYVDSYTDTRNGGSVPVSAWTTLDLNIGYQFQGEGFRRGLSLDIGANNLTDAAPPYVAPGIALLDGLVIFDGANADVRGRFLYGQLTKRF